MSKKRFQLKKDEDDHWYLIPTSLSEQFDQDCEEVYKTEEFDSFEEKYGSMRINSAFDLTFSDPKQD